MLAKDRTRRTIRAIEREVWIYKANYILLGGC